MEKLLPDVVVVHGCHRGLPGFLEFICPEVAARGGRSTALTTQPHTPHPFREDSAPHTTTFFKGFREMIAVDFLGERMPRILRPRSGEHISSVFMTRRVFEDDLARAFTDRDALVRQVELDAPRSVLEVDGQHFTHAPPIADELLLFCSQATMALAVELLHAGGELVLEPRARSPLVIKIDSNNGDVLAWKDLMVGPLHSATPLRASVHAAGDGVRLDFVGS